MCENVHTISVLCVVLQHETHFFRIRPIRPHTPNEPLHFDFAIFDLTTFKNFTRNYFCVSSSSTLFSIFFACLWYSKLTLSLFHLLFVITNAICIAMQQKGKKHKKFVVSFWETHTHTHPIVAHSFENAGFFSCCYQSFFLLRKGQRHKTEM